MKIQVNAELEATDLLGIVVKMFQDQGIAAKEDEVKIQVWSEKGQKFINFDDSKQIKFVYQK